MVTHITDHEARARKRFIEQFKNSKVIQAFSASLSKQIQQIEDALFQLLDERSIDTAIGAQLDVIGRIVGKAREGADDDTYRIRLRVQILLNLYSGTIPQIKEIIKLVTEGANTVQITENYPAALTVTLGGELLVSDTELFQILKQARMGGVRLELIYGLTDTPFRYASGDVPELNLINGYGDDLDPSIGGEYVGVLGDE